MGMDPVTIGLLGSAVVGAGSSLFGAHAQQQTNQANLNAQQQQQQYMQHMVGQYLQPSSAVNPYAQMMQQFMAPGGGAYQYQPPAEGAFNYTPTQTGAAPAVTAPQVGMPTPFKPTEIGGLGTIEAPNLGAAPQVSATSVQAPMPIGTSGYNAGQDALMQMMRRDIAPTQDPSINPMLQSGTQQYDNSALFKAMAPQDNQLLDEQVNALRGSAGSFGQRFGSAMQRNEANLRGQFANNVSARNAGIQQQSFEQAAGRNLQAAGVQAGREQNLNNMLLQNAQLQQGAAGQVGQLAQQGQGLDLQAQQVNAANSLQAQQANQGAGLQAGLANQQLAGQYGLQGAQMGMQAGQFNLANALQMMQGNQQAGLQAGLSGQSLLAQLMQGNQQAGLQAALANQGLAGQYGLANQNAMNQAGQFNAGMNQGQSQFNAQQGNIFNQLMMSSLMNQGGLQNQQQGLNASLLGILGGIGVPQQQVNPMYGAIGDAAQTGMMLPMLMQMMGQGGPSGTGPSAGFLSSMARSPLYRDNLQSGQMVR